MKLNARLRLAIFMIIIVVIIAFTSAVLNFLQYKKEVVTNEERQLQQVEHTIQSSLHALDKAYTLFDNQTTKQLKEDSLYLIQLYEADNGFDTWDFNRLSEELSKDIYIINEDNVISHSSYEEDIGLNFLECCQKLIPMFDERREEKDFYVSGIDVEQTTGIAKKYSYMGSPDGKYIIELGQSLHDDEIFNVFNFFDEIKQVEEQHSLIKQIRVLNIGGLALDDTQEELTSQQRQAFNQTFESQTTNEVILDWENQDATYRYSYYNTDTTSNTTSDKIIETVYDHNEVKQTIEKNFNTLLIQLSVMSIIILFISFIIYYWLSHHVYLARHDKLTGLKNRATFDEVLMQVINEKGVTNGLMMIDLDNFKTVNDTFGHITGDDVLKLVAETIDSTVNSLNGAYSTYRVGGDEFTVILPDTNESEVKRLAHLIRLELNKSLTRYKSFEGFDVTASIGIALDKQESTLNMKELYRRADIALYESKRRGKDCYYIFQKGETA